MLDDVDDAIRPEIGDGEQMVRRGPREAGW